MGRLEHAGQLESPGAPGRDSTSTRDGEKRVRSISGLHTHTRYPHRTRHKKLNKGKNCNRLRELLVQSCFGEADLTLKV